MNFNPNTTRQAQELIFSRKLKKKVHPPLQFNNANVTRTSSEKHLGIILDYDSGGQKSTEFYRYL